MNLLALVQAAVRLTRDHRQKFQGGNRGTPPGAIKCPFTVRTITMGGSRLHGLVMEELAPYRTTGTSRADISGPKIVLEPKSAQSIAMILHELTTNAVKYGGERCRPVRLGTTRKALRVPMNSAHRGAADRFCSRRVRLSMTPKRYRDHSEAARIK
jgi:hypothetical protein